MAGAERPRRWAATATAALLVLLGLPALDAAVPATAVATTGGTSIVNETFTGSSVADPAWEPVGDACLTGRQPGGGSGVVPSCESHQNGPVPAPGVTPGYLQLTDAEFFRSASILYDRPIPSSAGLETTFEQYQYGGQWHADGLAFFLVDGSSTLDTSGAYGGSLGYAQLGDPSYFLPGVPDAYLGVGLDVYGNFYGDGQGRGTDCPANQRSPSVDSGPLAPNTVTLRGPGNGTSGYCFLDSTTQPGPSVDRPISTLPGSLSGDETVTDPQQVKRTVRLDVTPSTSPGGPHVIVDIDFDDGRGFQEVLNVAAPANVPPTYKFGFASSTGGATDVHLLRNLVVNTVNPLNNLQLVKQIDRTRGPLPAEITEGTVVPYQFVVTNAGTETLNGLAIVDPSVTGIVCPQGPLPPEPDPGGTVVCRGEHTVTAADLAGGATDLSNTAHATATAPGPSQVRSPDSTVDLPLHASLSLAKSVDTPGPYAIGQQVNYDYTLTNTGGATVSSIGISDDRIPTGGVRCDLTSLLPQQSTPCFGSVSLTLAQLDSDGYVTNTAEASGTTPYGQQVQSPQAVARIPVAADIGVTKTASDTAPALGSDISFTVTTHNYGPSAATNVVISDPVPLGVANVSATVSSGAYDQSTGRWRLPSVAVGGSETLTLHVTLATSALVSNGARVDSLDQPDLNTANDTASVVVNPVEPTADIAVVKRAGAPTVVVGAPIGFTISATNNGPFAATGVQVTDTLPNNLTFVSATGDGSFDPSSGVWSIGNLANGGNATLTLMAQANAVGQANNVAARTDSAPRDPNAGNDVAIAPVEVLARTANLGVTKTVDRPGITTAEQATFTVTATNAGPDTAPTAQVLDPLPVGLTLVSAVADTGSYSPATGIWTLGAFPSGGRAVLRLTVTSASPGEFANSATISDPQVVDPSTDGNTASATLAVSLPQVLVDAAVTAATGDARLPVGQPTTVTITATNLATLPGGAAGSPVTGLVLQTHLPDGLEPAGSPVPEAGTAYDPATGRWAVGDLGLGVTRTLTLPVRVTAAQTLIASATLASLDQDDVNDTNNDAAASVTGFLSADLAITKTAQPAVATIGTPVTYTVSVTNRGPTAADDIEVVDLLPSGAEISNATASQGTLDGRSRVWQLGSLANGATATLVVTLPAIQFGTTVNTAAILSSDAADPDSTNDVATAAVQVPGADLAVTKAVDQLQPIVGGVATYTVIARNLGPDAATGVAVDEPVPAGARLVAATATAGSYADGRWAIGALASQSEATLTLHVVPTSTAPLVNTAAIAAGADPADPDPANNRASITVNPVPAPPDVAVGKSVSTNLVQVGEQVGFNLLATNIGGATATRVTLSDYIPNLVRLQSAPGCTIRGQQVTCTVATLPVGRTVRFQVTATAVTEGTFTNTVHLTSVSADAISQNNQASARLRVVGHAARPILPQPTVQPSAPVSPPPPPAQPEPAPILPQTGAPVTSLALLGLALLGVGAVLVLARRRR